MTICVKTRLQKRSIKDCREGMDIDQRNMDKTKAVNFQVFVWNGEGGTLDGGHPAEHLHSSV